MIEKANYQSGDVTKQDIKLWNDFTVKHEIILCYEILLGNVEYNLAGDLADLGREKCYIWLKRMSNAVTEAKIRFAEDKEYIQELEDIEFLIDYELA